MKIYPAANGEMVDEAEFVEQANNQPDARKYIARGTKYNEECLKYIMKHGSKDLRKQMFERFDGKRLTLDPVYLTELSFLGSQFDEEYLGLK